MATKAAGKTIHSAHSVAHLRIILTILMYAGIALFLFPYITGAITQGVLFMIFGAAMAVGCGLLRCYLTEGDCRHHESGRDW